MKRSFCATTLVAGCSVHAWREGPKSNKPEIERDISTAYDGALAVRDTRAKTNYFPGCSSHIPEIRLTQRKSGACCSCGSSSNGTRPLSSETPRAPWTTTFCFFLFLAAS